MNTASLIGSRDRTTRVSYVRAWTSIQTFVATRLRALLRADARRDSLPHFCGVLVEIGRWIDVQNCAEIRLTSTARRPSGNESRGRVCPSPRRETVRLSGQPDKRIRPFRKLRRVVSENFPRQSTPGSSFVPQDVVLMARRTQRQATLLSTRRPTI